MYDKIERSLPSLQTFVPQPHLDDHYAGMTWDHIRDIARDPLFEIGVHTVDHPFLTICDESEMERQVRVNRDELERMAGKPIRSIAYPSGDYDTTVAARCADSGMEVRYAVETRRGSGGVPLDDSCIPRIGVYRSSMNIVGFKVQWGNLLRRTPLKFG
jgi:peptidoglycan/xylan/chitin deacetylase (PgdA/CDA1 family)